MKSVTYLGIIAVLSVHAQDGSRSTAEAVNLQQQIAALQQRLKLATDERKYKNTDDDPLAIQNQLLEQWLRLASLERNLAKLQSPGPPCPGWNHSSVPKTTLLSRASAPPIRH